MTALGIGVRVWVGWCPDHENDTHVGSSTGTGVIIDGPNEPGVYETGCGLGRYDERTWRVLMDFDFNRFWVVESLLTPIDDSSETVETVEEVEQPCRTHCTL